MKSDLRWFSMLFLSVALGGNACASSAPGPLLQSPSPGATNVAPDTTLTWRWVDDLMVNGSFETGFSPGWYAGGQYPAIWAVYTDTTNAYGMGYKWAGSSMPNVLRSTGQVFQDLYIPADAISATLQWKERIYNTLPYTIMGRLRVLLYQGGVPVVLLEDAMGNEPQFLSHNWVSRSTNLLAYAGQNIQLVVQADGYIPQAAFAWFADVDGFGFSSEYFSAPPEFQVYLGKSSTLRSTNLVGTTSELSFAAPPLAPATSYFWRVAAVRDGVTNYSSTVQFKTGQRVLPQVTMTGRTATGVLLSFPTQANRSYTIEQLDAFDGTSTWYDLLPVGAGSGIPIQVEVTYPLNGTAFWRLRVSP